MSRFQRPRTTHRWSVVFGQTFDVVGDEHGVHLLVGARWATCITPLVWCMAEWRLKTANTHVGQVFFKIHLLTDACQLCVSVMSCRCVAVQKLMHFTLVDHADCWPNRKDTTLGVTDVRILLTNFSYCHHCASFQPHYTYNRAKTKAHRKKFVDQTASECLLKSNRKSYIAYRLPTYFYSRLRRNVLSTVSLGITGHASVSRRCGRTEPAWMSTSEKTVFLKHPVSSEYVTDGRRQRQLGPTYDSDHAEC